MFFGGEPSNPVRPGTNSEQVTVLTQLDRRVVEGAEREIRQIWASDATDEAKHAQINDVIQQQSGIFSDLRRVLVERGNVRLPPASPPATESESAQPSAEEPPAVQVPPAALPRVNQIIAELNDQIPEGSMTRQNARRYTAAIRRAVAGITPPLNPDQQNAAVNQIVSGITNQNARNAITQVFELGRGGGGGGGGRGTGAGGGAGANAARWTPELRTQYTEKSDALRAVSAEAETTQNEMEGISTQYRDHEENRQENAGQYRTYDGYAEQGRRAVTEQSAQLSQSFSELSNFRNQIIDAIERARLTYQQASEGALNWYMNWLRSSMAEIGNNRPELETYIFAMLFRDSGVQKGLSLSSVGGVIPPDLGALLTVTPFSNGALDSYNSMISQINGDRNRYQGQVRQLGEKEADIARRQAEAANDERRAQRFDRRRNIEEGLSDDLRAELEAKRALLATQRDQVRGLQGDLDHIRQQAEGTPEEEQEETVA